MNINSFAFALAMFFIYWLSEGCGLLFEKVLLDIENRRIWNKILKSIERSGL